MTPPIVKDVKVKVTSVAKQLLKMCHLRDRLKMFYFSEKFCSVLKMIYKMDVMMSII